ncbi:formylglycine-generating enzyme family protein [Halomicronema sp. CCY15110]|uniref:formylglycine-generating enzyme family protein n=1 Tax=Halomicronema sp. CCY15110 TaxID=2767773 RepID=UPI00194F3039|nr:formylglycine-generating enzyme family protein [Halomicronema sp. CCY15110]
MAELTLNRQRYQAQYFIESLGDGIDLEMTLIPAGTFLMGSPQDELERFDSEGPQHQVTVPSFFMGTYPVTQAQWRAVAGLPQVETELNPDPAKFPGDMNPVEQVNWHEAVEFCARLAAYTGRPYRLPSETEWEYACRAGTTTPFHFGETITTDLANYDGTAAFDGGPIGEYREKTTSVDHFTTANAFGLCDMHGNVWEWCQDVWHDNYDGAPTDGSAWTEGGNQDRRVARGGSWGSSPGYCRSASHAYDNPGSRFVDFGFRICCTAPQKQATAPGFS